jgi:hypothetical protein
MGRSYTGGLPVAAMGRSYTGGLPVAAMGRSYRKSGNFSEI